jgi:hypothetical protein
MAKTEAAVSQQDWLMGTEGWRAIGSWYNTQHSAELAWDGPERARIFGLSGLMACNLDYSLTDGG